MFVRYFMEINKLSNWFRHSNGFTILKAVIQILTVYQHSVQILTFFQVRDFKWKRKRSRAQPQRLPHLKTSCSPSPNTSNKKKFNPTSSVSKMVNLNNDSNSRFDNSNSRPQCRFLCPKQPLQPRLKQPLQPRLSQDLRLDRSWP